MRVLLLVLVGTVLGSRTELRADDATLVPGERAGGVTVGMERAQVMRLLGTPYQEVDLETTAAELMRITEGHPLHGDVPKQDFTGIIRDDWITPLPLPKEDGSVQYMADFLVVYFKERRVIQIEIRGKGFHLANGLSTHSTAQELMALFPKAGATTWLFHHPSSGGWPAPKRIMTFQDAQEQGLAWEYGAMGGLFPDPDPKGELDTPIVHRPGLPVLIDPDANSRFVWKDAPLRPSGS